MLKPIKGRDPQAIFSEPAPKERKVKNFRRIIRLTQLKGVRDNFSRKLSPDPVSLQGSNCFHMYNYRSPS